MPTLTLKFKDNVISEYVLEKGKSLNMGRREDNNIVIDNLAVSGHHAKVDSVGDGFLLTDLQSKNGSFVNEQFVASHWLKHGDVITIGKHELRYLNDSKQFADDGDKTVLIRRKPEAAKALVDSHEIEYTPDLQNQAALDSAKLQILNGRSAGRELPLVKASVKLGKSGAEVVQINKRPDGHFIISLIPADDENNPRVNGEVIGARSIKLQNHDVIEINRLKIEFYLSNRAS